MSSSAREAWRSEATRRQSMWPGTAPAVAVLVRSALEIVAGCAAMAWASCGARVRAAYALKPAIFLLRLPPNAGFWQYSCHVQGARSPRPADPRGAAGRCAHLEPGAREARRALSRPVLAAAPPARGSRIHRRLRDAAQGCGDRVAHPRVRARLAGEPSPRIGAPVRSARQGASRGARMPLDERRQ